MSSTLRSFGSGRFGKARIAITGLLVVAGLLWGVTTALAVHNNGMFELDGNTVHTSATTPPYDWNSLFGATGNRLITPDPVNGPLLADTFVSDSTNPDQSYFTSNKDIQPIASGQQHWGCDPINNPLDKDNLLNAYAALVQVPANAPDNAGHQVLYLASERGSNNGTSFAGFWLLKDKSVACSGSNDFSGQHTDGDLLIVSDYTNGGGTQDVTVYRWTGDDASGTLVQQSTLNGSICGSSPGNDNACAIANDSAITTPWSPTSHASNTFVEAGIDLTTLLGANGGCFTNFLAETRSSNQLTATLKDFAGGQFSTCVPPTIATTATPGGSLNPTGVATQHDVATISPVGGRPNPTGTLTFFLCNPSQVTAGGCVSGGTQVGGAVTIVAGSATSENASGSLTTATGKYCWRAEYAPDTPSSNFYSAGSHTDATGECFTVVHASPTISTQIAVTGANAPGLRFTTLGDSAQLSGFVGSVTGETITFKLYGPFAGAVPSTCTAGSAVFTTTGSLNASGQATTSTTFDPTAAGTYVWIASYPGDTLNDKVDGTCSDAHESATIVASQIEVAKSANPAGPVSEGDAIGFDITVTNPGSVPATDVHVHDVLPAGADGVAGGDLNWALDPAYTGCAITGAVGSQVLDCNFSQVDPGSLLVIHISSSTASADCGVVKNKATVSTTNGSGTDSDLASVTVQCPDLSVTKLTGNGTHSQTVNAGDPVEFTIVVANAGPGTAKNVGLDDPLPNGTTAGWTIKSQTNANQCSITAGNLTCSGVDLGAGDSYSIDITADTDLANCTTYDNTATASSDNAGNPSDEATITCQKPGVSVTKLADNGKHSQTVDAGDDIGFSITVANAGPGTAKNVTLDDVLPAGSGAGVTWSIDSGPSGDATPTCSISNSSPQELTCSAVDLGADKSYTLHITAKTSFAECTEYDNTATASADNAPDASDSADITCKPGKVSITKTADHSAPVHAGDQIGFTVEVKNTGTGAVHGVVLNDPLPTGSGSGVTWTIDPSTGTPSQFVLSGAAGSQTLSLASGTLPAGADYKVHVVALTSQTECSVYDNTATLTTTNANHPEPASASESCAYRVDLSVTKAGSPATQDLGAGNITWTIVVKNNGPDTDTGVTIADPMPGGNTFVSATTSQGTCTGGAVLNCNIGTMAAGATVTITLVTTPSAAGPQTNTATVAGSRPETNTGNNQATATVQITAPFVPPPVYCVAVSRVTPHQLFVGRKTALTIHLTKHGRAVKGIKVRIKGPKLNLTTKRSNAKGVVKQVVKMKKAGIIIFSPIASKRCNTKRVGVTNVFTPPVTG